MLNCKQVTHLLSEMQERDLLWRERLPLKLHLLMCAGCNNFRKQMDFLRRVCREYAQGRPDSTPP
ncbi:MAG TPA: zf-HC2 domain-containing protein [Candidatus Competibacter phosphatis]|nr:zf-HC2 domain-containing protein [Candidatus Competibacter phosphatis]HMR04096.1 zf-HC2 domain-containing protein [Candidatus Competibacter phosphatis]